MNASPLESTSEPDGRVIQSGSRLRRQVDYGDLLHSKLCFYVSNLAVIVCDLEHDEDYTSRVSQGYLPVCLSPAQSSRTAITATRSLKRPFVPAFVSNGCKKSQMVGAWTLVSQLSTTLPYHTTWCVVK